MSTLDYTSALKLGKKMYNSRINRGKFPYLPVLEDIVNEDQIESEVSLGIDQIPLRLVVGTCNKARTNAFAKNFMPLLEVGTEFSAKWISLSESQVNEGIRDPIKVYEYMNKFYVLEGNKRVSVLKYFNAVTVLAEVIRKVPKKSDEPSVQIYYEFMDFYKSTRINDIYFSEVGSFPTLMELVGIEKNKPMEDEDKQDFVSCLLAFRKAYNANGGYRFDFPDGDAFLRFIHIFGYNCVKKMTPSIMMENVKKSWEEFELLQDDSEINLVMNPGDTQIKKSIFDRIIPWGGNKKIKVGFIYDDSPQSSDWCYGHDLGRQYVEQKFNDQIETVSVYNVKPEVNDEQTIKDLIKEGCRIIFVTSATMIIASVKMAIANRQVKIINCSLNISHKYVRTYYARMYEAKFLTGLLAGALSNQCKIGYVAQFPIYGAIANINAFAIGVKFVNPRARIYLEWSSQTGVNIEERFKANGIKYISDQDMITPQCSSRKFGLYNNEGVGNRQHIAMPVMHWGVFYEKIIKTIMNGNWNSSELSEDTKALNYWWGMSAGVVDLICSDKVPVETGRLVESFRKMICEGEFEPFSDELYDQNRRKRNKKGQKMNPEDIVTMDWLLDNVVGNIPEPDQLSEDGRALISKQGIEQDYSEEME